MKPTLQSSKNHDMFVANPEQRLINDKHVRGIAESIAKNGFRPGRPITCYRKDGKLVVVDGHHRLAASKLLGSTFFYVVEGEDSQDIMPILNGGLKWKPIDFVRQYAMRGMRDYEILRDYVNMGIPLNCAAGLLAGNGCRGGLEISTRIAAGTYKVKTTDKINLVASLIIDNEGCKVFRHYGFIHALSMMLLVPEFDFGTFKSRVERNMHMLPNCSNGKDFLTAINEIYNYRRPIGEREDLSLKAIKASANRSPIKK